MIKKPVLHVTALLVSCGALIAGAQQQNPNRDEAQASKNIVGQPEPTGGPVVEQGKMLFRQKCGFCHGPDATGGEGPDLLRSSLVSHDMNGNLVGQVVREGRPGKGMPPFQFSDTQIQEIAAFLHDQARASASLYLSDRSVDYPVEKLLVGSTEAGKVFFDGPGKCTTCHSLSGDLAHIASKYKPLDLQSRIVFPKGAEPTITVTLPSGSSLSGRQIYADAFLVSFRDGNGWVHTFTRNTVKVAIHDPLAAHEALLESYTDKDIHDLFAYLETAK